MSKHLTKMRLIAVRNLIETLEEFKEEGFSTVEQVLNNLEYDEDILCKEAREFEEDDQPLELGCEYGEKR